MLKVENLKVTFHTKYRTVKAVDDISFELSKGEFLAIVGESGSGKSITSLSILKLVDGSETSGRITYENQNILQMSEDSLEQIRGKEIAMVFQEPMTSLNPVFTVGRQIEECIVIHEGAQNAKQKTIDMLKQVEIPTPESVYSKYPHQLSGGMRQRIMIAMALSCSPKILIADEPTTALDVTIQAQILDLLKTLQKKFSMLFITHDLGIVAEYADNVMVMYCGKIVEKAAADVLFDENSVKHPYTKALLDSSENLIPIEGSVPETAPNYCAFADRCPNAKERCFKEIPTLEKYGEEHYIACFYPCGRKK